MLAEQNAGDRADYQLRTLMSEGSLTTLTVTHEKKKKMKTLTRTVFGPTCFISTTTRPSLHPENETRVLEVALDESQAQNDRIVTGRLKAAATTRKACTLLRTAELEVWHKALTMVGADPVLVPESVSQLLKSAVNLDRTRSRRDVGKLLALVRASARLFKFQRTIDSGGYVVASEEDANRAFALAGPLRAALSPQVERTFDRLRERYGSSVFTNVQAAVVLGLEDPESARKKLLHLELSERAERVLGDGQGRHRGRPATRWRLVLQVLPSGHCQPGQAPPP